MADVEIERREGIVTITLNRPQVRNAIDPSMAQTLAGAIIELENNPDLCVAILRGRVLEPNPVFCAGADLKSRKAVKQKLVDGIDSGEPSIYTSIGGFAGLTRYPRTKPVIAAVDGLATAGGLELVMACDLVVASKRSSFCQAEVRLGTVAAAGALFRLPWALGRAAALDLILTGDRMPAERAYQLGLVSTLVETGDEVYAAARERAEMICKNSPQSVRESYHVASRAFVSSIEELWQMLDEAKLRILRNPDALAGVNAFLNKTHAQMGTGEPVERSVDASAQLPRRGGSECPPK
jgi:enoyl-CoA hydratase